jgi:hypothetical protein
MTTQEHAEFLAKHAVETLWSDGDLFKGEIDPDSLEKNLLTAFLVKLVESDSDILEESEFKECLKKSRT